MWNEYRGGLFPLVDDLSQFLAAESPISHCSSLRSFRRSRSKCSLFQESENFIPAHLIRISFIGFEQIMSIQNVQLHTAGRQDIVIKADHPRSLIGIAAS